MTNDELFKICHKLFYIQDGKLIRKITKAPNAVAGREAGNIDKTLCKSNNGYKRVKIDRKSYLSHRIIYLMMTGEMPDFIDHVNGDSLDNRLENLRATTKAQNRWNCKPNTGSNTGIKGVYLDGSKYKALINVAGKRYYLGMYFTKEQAAEVVRLKYLELQGEFSYCCKEIMEQTK